MKGKHLSKYAVIFRAKAGQQDAQYLDTVSKLRELAFEKYGCLEFVAVTEGEQEIAISYWPDETSIKNWRMDAEHQVAQKLGQEKWYQSYSVEVVEIKRHYQMDGV